MTSRGVYALTIGRFPHMASIVVVVDRAGSIDQLAKRNNIRWAKCPSANEDTNTNAIPSSDGKLCRVQSNNETAYARYEK